MAGGGGANVAAMASRVVDTAARIRFRIAACILWVCAVTTTQLFLAGLMPAATTGTVWLAAAALQLVLTVVQSEFWSGQRGQVSTFAVLVDTGINAAGIWPYIQNLDRTNVWDMIAELTGVGGTMSPLVAGFLAIIIGYILAAAPERVWR
jgi:hypothetical protein